MPTNQAGHITADEIAAFEASLEPDDRRALANMIRTLFIPDEHDLSGEYRDQNGAPSPPTAPAMLHATRAFMDGFDLALTAIRRDLRANPKADVTSLIEEARTWRSPKARATEKSSATATMRESIGDAYVRAACECQRVN